MILSHIFFILFYSYTFFIVLVGIHLIVLKRSKGTFQQKEWASFGELFQEEGLQVLFNFKVILPIFGVIYSQQRIFVKSFLLKRDSEFRLSDMIHYVARVTAKESQGIILTELENKSKKIATNNILQIQSDLFYIQENLGFKSVFLSNLSNERIETLKKNN